MTDDKRGTKRKITPEQDDGDIRTRTETLIDRIDGIHDPSELFSCLIRDEFDWSWRHPERGGHTLLMKLAWLPSLCTIPIIALVMEKITDSDLTATIYGNSTALHFAATTNNVNLVNVILLKNDSQPFVTRTNAFGRTAMEVAAWKGCHEVVDIFLRYGILTDNLMSACLHHCNLAKSARLVQLVLQSRLPIFEDYNSLKREVSEWFGLTQCSKEYVNEVMQCLDIIGAQKQKEYSDQVNALLLNTTNLIPVLISIVGQYARLK